MMVEKKVYKPFLCGIGLHKYGSWPRHARPTTDPVKVTITCERNNCSVTEEWTCESNYVHLSELHPTDYGSEIKYSRRLGSSIIRS